MPRTTPSLDLLKKIAADVPTPFHLYDAEGIASSVRELQQAFAWNPGFVEYFAVKATPTPAILRLVKELGCGVDCATYTELLLAHELGFRGEEIMFSSNVTPGEDFELARALDVIINLDDLSHIDFLAEHGGVPERVSLRYNPGGDFRLGTRVMGNPAESKFGISPAQMSQAVRRLQELGVREFGLHTFLASNTTDPDYYPTIARMLFELAVELHDSCGAEFFLVNLSGGIGIPYEPGQERADLAAIGREVERAYREVIVPAGLDPLPIVSELGRFITGPNGWLVTTAVHEKHTHKRYLGLDASASNLMRPSMYGAYHHITIAGAEEVPSTEVYDVTGALCENNDKFAIDRALPTVSPGDLVVIHDTGAHGHSMGHNYNGKLRSAEVLLESDGSYRVIRRAETPRDYFATVAGFGVSEDIGSPERDPLSAR